MPVIACPDCGRDVSTLAPACPHCGRPSPGLSAPAVAGAAPPSPAHEETLWRGWPSLIVLFGHVVLMLIVMIAGLVLGTFVDTPNNHAVLWITGAILAILLVRFFIALMKQRSTIYTVTNQRVIIEQGVLSKSLSEIDLRYIDELQFSQTFIDRMLGIGTVTLVSSDKVFPTTALRKVKDPRGVREIIRAQAYQVSQRQLFTRAT